MSEVEPFKSEQEQEKTPDLRVRRWIAELDLAKKRDKDWLSEASSVIKKYEGRERRNNSFNILWSNTETMRPALYNSTPSPDVRRRYRDSDPLGKASAQVLERGLEYSIDIYDFDDRMKDLALDTLLPGRGVLRVKYDFESFQEETEERDEQGNKKIDKDGKPMMRTEEFVSSETAECEFVQHDDFRHGPGKRWAQVMWVAFRHKMTRDELVNKFGREKAEKVPLSDVDSEFEDKEIRETFRTGEVWEIWDKRNKKVLFISVGLRDEPLKELEDPLGLSGFYPTPRPLYAVEQTKSLIPIPYFRLYEEQAKELDRISNRINKIVDALRVRGLYPGQIAEIEQMMEAGETDLVPITNFSEIMNLGLDRLVWIMPIEKIASVLRHLYEAREQIKQTIYEITGISDILRGSTVANETATAQRIKSNWGSLRLQRLQREIQRYARDIIRLKAEIIAEHFQIETLQSMTELKFPRAQEKQQAQMALMQAQRTGQQPPQELTETLQQPTWEEIQDLLQNDLLRQYRIDIETDSTVAEQVTGDVEGLTEVLTGLVSWFNGAGPLVQQGFMPPQSAKDIALAVVRRARMGSVVEDAIEEMGSQPQQPQQKPQPEQQGPDPQTEMLKLQLENKELQIKNQEMQLESQRLRLEQMETQADVRNTDADTQLKMAQTEKARREAQQPVAMGQ